MRTVVTYLAIVVSVRPSVADCGAARSFAAAGGPMRAGGCTVTRDRVLRTGSMTIGTPLSPSATRVLLLGSGELGKEVAIELQRLGCEVIACDRYAEAPAMQVAHRSHVLSMLDGEALRAVIDLEQPHLVVPEIEAIATDVLVELEAEGLHVVPTARAAHLTMNREGIRRFAAEELGLPTSPYRFVASADELRTAIAELGLPAVLKPIMSSSGKGQSVVRSLDDVEAAWTYAQEGGRAGAARCIVEGFVDFDVELTAADGVGGQRRPVLCTDRSRAGRRRLPRVVAAGPDLRGAARARARRGGDHGGRGARRSRHLRRRAVLRR